MRNPRSGADPSSPGVRKPNHERAERTPELSLLDERLFGVEDVHGTRARVTLPELLARWCRGELLELTALQAHQQHAWHAFVVQLGALALARAGRSELPTEDDAWRKLLIDCAAADGAGPEAFALVVPDLAKPAFMQPPIPEGTLEALKNVHDSPSGELDVLITSKNHDVKANAIQRPTSEDWALGLVTLQTTQGFLGAGNYGIARMNGGFSSRPCVSYAGSLDSRQWFIRDVDKLLAARGALRESGFAASDGLGLIWCAPWDGVQSLSVTQLDPFFIEICRRVRLTRRADGDLVARRGSSKAARIGAAELAGNTGDPWTPVAQNGKALTMPEAGFTYDRVQNLMFGEWVHGAAGTPDAADALWVGRVLVRGQGKTGGFHERWVPVPPRARLFMSNEQSRGALGKRAQYWVEQAAAARLQVLKPAVLAFLQGGPEKLKFDDPRAEPALRAFDAAVDGVFFSTLFEHAEAPPEEADAAFSKLLFDLARAELERCFTALPTSSARRPRAVAYAERAFHGAARKRLGQPPLPQPSQQGAST